MPADKTISVIVGRGTDPLRSISRYCYAVQNSLSAGDLCRRAVFNIVDAPATGSNLSADAVMLDSLLEVWTGKNRLRRVLGILRDLQRQHDVDAMHFGVEENTVIPGGEGRAAVKRLTLIRRLDGLSRDGFRKHWTNVHGEIARGLPFSRGYTQNIVTTGDGALDGFAILRFDAVDHVQAAFGSPLGKRLISDTPLFCGAAASYQLSEREILLAPNKQESNHGRA